MSENIETTTEESRLALPEAFACNSACLPETLFRLRKKLYIKAKREPNYRFYSLYDRIYRPDVLAAAWDSVAANHGKPGVDGISIEQIRNAPDGVAGLLERLRQDLQQKRYRPQAVRRVLIPKSNGGTRPLGIPTVYDRIVQTAAKLVLEPIFEADFMDTSYGFRPRRNAHQALAAIERGLRRGKTAVYDADLQGYFDSIPHDKLMACVERRIADRSVLTLIRQWLNAPVQEGNGPPRRKAEKTGTPQGGVISPLLANLYLHWLDKRFQQRGGPAQFANAEIVRYADDFVILAKYLGQGVSNWIEAVIEDWMGLTINRSKTQIIQLREAGTQLNFLGYSYRYDRDRNGRPRRYLKLFPSDAACQRQREKVRQLLTARTAHVPAPQLIARLNRQLRGWQAYFGQGYPRAAFRRMNWYVCGKVIKHLKRRSQRPYRPPAGVTWYQHLYDNLGLIQL